MPSFHQLDAVPNGSGTYAASTSTGGMEMDTINGNERMD